jgi:hypothetical protein
VPLVGGYTTSGQHQTYTHHFPPEPFHVRRLSTWFTSMFRPKHRTTRKLSRIIVLRISRKIPASNSKSANYLFW